MKYIPRHIEKTVRRAARSFAAVLITGARQTGKTRLLREMYPDLTYVTMDNHIHLDEALRDPAGFFKMHPPPAVLDEIQYAPGLFTQIKLIADGIIKDGVRAQTAGDIGEALKGRFFMTGSQQYSLMQNVSESLAGRIGIFNLYGLSLREIFGIDFTEPFLPTEEYLKKRKQTVKHISYRKVWEIIRRGGYPELQNPKLDWETFYGAYVKTYIERDVRQIVNIGDALTFHQFMIALAARNGQLLNFTSIAEDIGVSLPTIKRWVSILQTSNIIYLLRPYHNNAFKRAISTPKLYFSDSGLACYLSGWNTSEALERGAAAGHIFEAFCVSEIIKSRANAGRESPLYFYRDKEKHEIDLLIYENGVLYPLEIKKYSSPRAEDVKSFNCLDNVPGIKRGHGGIICLCDEPVSLGGGNTAIPLEYL